MKKLEKARVNKLHTSATDSELSKAVDFANKRKDEKERVISDELFARFKLERSIWNFRNIRDSK